MPKSIHAKPYLAFDFGAQSGRAVLAHLQSGILTTEEVYRFTNESVEYGGTLHWDVARLWFEMRKVLAVDSDDDSFLRPTGMLAAIDKFCTRTHQPIPHEPGAYVRAVLESLAFKYRMVLQNLEHVSGKRIGQIRIIGGGSKNRLLNQLTADATGRKVPAGPAEAAALKNVAIQILATGGAASLQEVRAIVDRSFPTEVFDPLETDKWDQHAERFEQYCGSIYA